MDTVAKVYELVVEASIIFNKMGIDTRAVLEAAGTKWNFLKFFPGLVGEHGIGIVILERAIVDGCLLEMDT